MTDDPTPGLPGDRGTGAAPSRATTGLRAGVAAMLIGAVLVGVGVVATTSASDQPSCPTGSTELARFDLVEGVYQPSTGGEVPVAIADGTPTGGTWTSSTLVSAVVVKGGPGSVATTVEPAQLAGAFDNAQLAPVEGVVPEILSVQFCGPLAPQTLTQSQVQPYTVTLAARTCPTYTDIIANRNRNNIQESLEDLGPDTNYGPGEVVNPAKEAAAPQDNCSPLTGWDFQWGTGITGKSPATAELSTVTGENAIATTTPSVPELDAAGNDTGRVIEGAVTYELTAEQIDRVNRGRLWIQGGTKALPLGDRSTSFGALRCATDNANGDNVEYVRYPNQARHVFCYAYYVAQPPEPVSITVRKQLTETSAGGMNFEFTGDTSFIPGGTFTLRPEQAGGSAEITFVRAADVAWTVAEAVPEGWTLQSLECTPPASGRQVLIDGSSFVANLAAGDETVCTFTNDDSPPPTTTTTTEPTTTTTEPTTTGGAAANAEVSGTAVGGRVIVETEVTPDDALANGPAVLAFTGGSATPVLVIGIVLLILGATLSAVSRQRRGTA